MACLVQAPCLQEHRSYPFYAKRLNVLNKIETVVASLSLWIYEEYTEHNTLKS